MLCALLIQPAWSYGPCKALQHVICSDTYASSDIKARLMNFTDYEYNTLGVWTFSSNF